MKSLNHYLHKVSILEELKIFISILLSACILLISGCGNSEDQDILTWDEAKMIDIIFDLRIMDNQVKKHHIQERDSVSKKYIELIYDIHNITKEELINNLKIIQRNPRLAKKIEDKVLKKMVQRAKEKDIFEQIE